MKIISTDVLVLGSGIAGLSFAIKAASFAKVAVITKSEIAESNTRYAQGGIACVLDDKDDFKKHIQDTLIAGAGHCNESAVEMMVTKAPEMIKELMNIGVEFDTNNKKLLELGREGGHSHNRIVHVNDMSGQAVENALIKKAKANSNIKFYENHFAAELLKNGEVCVGASVWDVVHEEYLTFESKYTVLATGGAGQVYIQTTNPEIATGDGCAMAYKAGAKIGDMEFVQFHPTALFHQNANGFLISEALRGFGAELVLPSGKPFMKKYHPHGSLAPRDIVSRAIFSEMQKYATDFVYLNARHLSAKALVEKFPVIYSTCLSLNIDITKDLIPVMPAAHYMCGGVLTDLTGATNIENLYAIGEVACTGVHGANRLASNSLLEGLVFADRAFYAIKDKISKFEKSKILLDQVPVTNFSNIADEFTLQYLKNKVRQIMWNDAGIIRNKANMTSAYRSLDQIEHTINGLCHRYKPSSNLFALRSIVITAKLIMDAAIKRNNSIGSHYIENKSAVKNKDQVLV